MKKFKVEFDILFNKEIIKTLKFKVEAESETEAHDIACEMIESRQKFKIKSIEPTVEKTKSEAGNKIDNLSELLANSDSIDDLSKDQMDEIIDHLTDLTAMFNLFKKMKQ